MIQKPTVFVLGAGASAPYAYPLGEDLVKRVVASAGGAGQTYAVLVQQEPTLAGILREFHLRLGGSETNSIDDFLESNPEFAEIGKLCIATVLTVGGPAHDQVTEQFHWYRYLWRQLHEGAGTLEAFKANTLKVITYNYDRSFERYFARVLENTYPELAREGHEAAAAVQAEVIPAIHLHGSLGQGGDEVIRAPDRNPYHNLAFYRRVAAGLRIVHEEHPTEAYGRAHAWLRDAEVVCFLGFGYHPTNVKRLALLDQVRGRTVFVGGTVMGLKEAEISRAEARLAIGGPRTLFDIDALTYLRTYAPLE